MPLVYGVSLPDGARWSRLWIGCPHHPDETVLVLETFDGERVLYGHDGTMREEFVGPLTNAEDRELIEQTFGPGFASFPVAEAEGESYRRLGLRCPRPSCAYDYQLRAEDFDITVASYVRRMWAAGIAETRITDLDKITRAAHRMDR